MFRLRIESHFDAAHKLVGYKGKCAKLHGHSWKVEVFIVGERLNKIGILIDFNLLKERLNKTIKKFDHSLINDFKEIGNPTSENLSKYIFHNLENLPEGVRLEKVRIWESDKCYAEYFEKGDRY